MPSTAQIRIWRRDNRCQRIDASPTLKDPGFGRSTYNGHPLILRLGIGMLMLQKSCN